MKSFLTLVLFFVSVTFLQAKEVIFPGTSYLWTSESAWSVTDGDKIVVVSGQEITINNPTAPNVSIEVRSGGRCDIRAISNKSGQNIEVQVGGVLSIKPKSDIIIGQNVTVKGLDLVEVVDDATALSLLSMNGKLAKLNVVGDGDGGYPKVTFAGNLTVEYGGFFDVATYPANLTGSQIAFNHLHFKAVSVPKEVVPFIAGSIPDGYKSYSDILSYGVVPPAIFYASGAKKPVVSGNVVFDLKVLKIVVALDKYRGEADENGFTVPNGTYLSKELDMSALEVPVSDGYSKAVPLNISVPDAGSYTVTLPRLVSDSYAWGLVDSKNPDFRMDLSAFDATKRKYTLDLQAGVTGRLSFVGGSVTSVESNVLDVAAQVVSTSYYTLSGVQVANPISGIYVARVVYDNGEVKVRKVFLD